MSLATVRFHDQAAKTDSAILDSRMTGNRRAAGAIECGQEPPLGGERRGGLAIVDRRDTRARGDLNQAEDRLECVFRDKLGVERESPARPKMDG